MDPGGEVTWGVDTVSGANLRNRSPGASSFDGFHTFEYEQVSMTGSTGAAPFFPMSPTGNLTLDDDEEDLPLLTELGINPEHIKSKALAVLNPLKIKNTESCKEYIDDEDLAAYGVTGCLLMYGLLNLMCETQVGVQFTLSILGYNILPISILALISALGWLLLTTPGFIVYTTCAVFILWSAWCATQVCFAICPKMCALHYPCFRLLTVSLSRLRALVPFSFLPACPIGIACISMASFLHCTLRSALPITADHQCDPPRSIQHPAEQTPQQPHVSERKA
ncbi:Protein YIPF5-like protein [Diplonema papillatum]|nr:Protein YIPF5-like protein [Diplonema papillatum]